MCEKGGVQQFGGRLTLVGEEWGQCRWEKGLVLTKVERKKEAVKKIKQRDKMKMKIPLEKHNKKAILKKSHLFKNFEPD